ncbi:hypothetical protein GCM10008967_17470 [Bacillus carboniphilus]|uniref:Uncharacterized protein n=1 Tax=Bacillus carboniphilus TaxID=86663 RepID=A0ABP3FWP7_9BACI
MKKTGMMIILFMLLFMAGCSNEELESQIEQLKGEAKEIKNEKELLQLEVIELEEQLTRKKEEKNTLKQELEAFSSQNGSLEGALDIYSELLNESEVEFKGVLEAIRNEVGVEKLKELKIFSPENIVVGEQVGDFLVTSVKNEEGVTGETNYFVQFQGEFEIEGELIANQGASGYLFLVDAKEFLKFPQTIEHLSSPYKISFKVANTEFLLEEVGDQIEEVDLTFDSFPLRAIFTDYSFNYVPYTDIRSSAMLKKVVDTDM